MRVRVTCSIAGSPGRMHGDLVELPDAVARAWIEAGIAIVAPPATKTRQPAVDTATADPAVETAVAHKGRKRR